ncbi:MAG: HupE/UreJ family protein [Pseudomonadota bacterium]
MSNLHNFVLRWLVVAGALIAGASAASAHSTNQSYIYYFVTETTLGGSFETEFKTLGAELDIDADGDGTITEEEIRAEKALIDAYLVDNIRLADGLESLTIRPGDIDVLRKNGLRFAKIAFEVSGFETTPETVRTTFTGMWNTFGTDHEMLVLIATNTRTGLEGNNTAIGTWFTANDFSHEISLNGMPTFTLLGEMIEQGVLHIWLSFDHVLFMIALLIPAVMVVAAGRWEATEGLGGPFLTVLKLVTIFTIAHSVTLTVAAYGYLRLPERVVEAMIAVSIAYVALSILIPRLHRHLVWVIVFFGLFHGMGYAISLEPVIIEPNQILMTLLGFNLGIEIGQIAIILVVFPVLYLLRTTQFYDWVVMRAGSVVLLAISLLWLEQKTLNVMGPVLPTIRNLIGV